MFAYQAGAALRGTGALSVRRSVRVLPTLVSAVSKWRATAWSLPTSSTMSRPIQTSSSSASATVAAPTAAEGETTVKFSAGVDEAALTAALQELLSSAGKGGRWTLIPSGKGLERSFKFKNFTKTWDFMTAVSLQCKLKNHHPEWSNVYNTTYIRWITHVPSGLSAKDVELAKLCDVLARDFGEEEREVVADSCELGRQVADRITTDAGDCCTSKTRGSSS
ncbi:transcriptional coactivator/pterin dehydratase [Poronia punctata]|nr:transcriptional coactivator/pterin dehydratase [Poronia punctata]